MTPDRLRAAATVLLLLALFVDVAAFGVCVGDLIPVPATDGGTVASSDADDACASCAGAHCFCCSSGAEVIIFELIFPTETAPVAPARMPTGPALSVSDDSPPPRS